MRRFAGMVNNSFSHLGGKTLFWLFIVSWLIFIPVLQSAVGAGDVRTRTTTITEYSTVTMTETEEETITNTLTTTITGTRVEESVYETSTIVITRLLVPIRTFRVTFSNSFTTYWITEGFRHETVGIIRVPITEYYTTLAFILSPTNIGILTTELVTLTESSESIDLVESLTTRTKLITMTLTNTYRSEFMEEFEIEPEKEETQFVAIPMNYLIIGAIIAAIAVIAIATLKRRPHVAGARYCTKCGATIPRGSKFCLKCGAEQE